MANTTISTMLATTAVLALTACGGGGAASNINPSSTFSLSNIQNVSAVNTPTIVYNYDVTQNNESYRGYIITNNTSEFRAGNYEALAAGDYKILSVGKREPNYFGGVVEYNGEQYIIKLTSVGDNEIILAIPRTSPFHRNGWNINDNEAFPENSVLRAIGPSGSSITLTGTAEYDGRLNVVGGVGLDDANVSMTVNFDNMTGTFRTEPQYDFRSGPIKADILIDGSTGSFSSTNVTKAFKRVSNAETITGQLSGNFTGESQNGAVGAIWSDPGQPQFKGVFALSR